MSVRHLLATGLAATGLVALAPAARAADLDYGYGDAPPPPVAEEKVEFGSGWYIRGDIGATKLPSLQLTPPSDLVSNSSNYFAPSPPTAVLGTGHNIGYVASLGAGYQFNNWFRTDVLADFGQPLSTFGTTSPPGSVFCPTGASAGTENSGACTGRFTAHVNRYDVLVNGYLDFGRWQAFSPYVGAGVGLSFGHYHTAATYIQGNGVPYENIAYQLPGGGPTYNGNYDSSAGGSYQTFAFALMAGVAVDVFDHTKLDIGYRYLNLGSIPGVSGTLSEHEVRAGLRYLVDN